MSGVCNFDIQAGETATFTITWRDAGAALVNLTGYSASLRIQDEPVLELTSGNGIVLGGALGTIAITLTAAQTAQLSGNAKYNLDLTSGGGVTTRLLKGRIRVEAAV